MSAPSSTTPAPSELTAAQRHARQLVDAPHPHDVAAAAAIAAAEAAQRSFPQRAVLRASSMVLMLAVGALVIVVIAAAVGVRFRVERTGSMSPALRTGDLIALKAVPITRVRPGQVIGVRDPQGAVIVHRVLQIAPTKHHEYAVVTRGDANPTSEHWSLASDKPVALVVGRLPYAGAAITHLHGALIALIVLLAGGALAVLQLRSVWKRA